LVLPKAENVFIKYVDFVSLKPSFIKFDFFPYAILKKPGLGLYVSEDGEIKPNSFKYLSLNVNADSSVPRIWKPGIISPEFIPEDSYEQKYQRELLEQHLIHFSDERVYLINEGPYRDLGNLIPLVELPLLSFLPQSRDLEELVKMIKDSEPHIKSMREAAKNLKRAFKETI